MESCGESGSTNQQASRISTRDHMRTLFPVLASEVFSRIECFDVPFCAVPTFVDSEHGVETEMNR